MQISANQILHYDFYLSQRRHRENAYAFFERLGEEWSEKDLIVGVIKVPEEYQSVTDYGQCAKKACRLVEDEFYMKNATDIYTNFTTLDTFTLLNLGKIDRLPEESGITRRFLLKATSLFALSLSKHGGNKCQKLLIRAS